VPVLTDNRSSAAEIHLLNFFFATNNGQRD
jgi:hypothetical protein